MYQPAIACFSRCSRARHLSSSRPTLSTQKRSPFRTAGRLPAPPQPRVLHDRSVYGAERAREHGNTRTGARPRPVPGFLGRCVAWCCACQWRGTGRESASLGWACMGEPVRAVLRTRPIWLRCALRARGCATTPSLYLSPRGMHTLPCYSYRAMHDTPQGLHTTSHATGSDYVARGVWRRCRRTRCGRCPPRPQPRCRS
eukprot:944868-Prymnesium_polylepis.2